MKVPSIFTTHTLKIRNRNQKSGPRDTGKRIRFILSAALHQREHRATETECAIQKNYHAIRRSLLLSVFAESLNRWLRSSEEAGGVPTESNQRLYHARK